MTHTPSRFRTVAVAILALAGATMALAADAFDRNNANISLLQQREVQQDMGIGEDLRAKLNKHADWFNGEMKKLQDAFQAEAQRTGKAPNPPEAKIQKLQQDFAKRVMGELNDKQIVRLRELTIQSVGFPALMNDDVAKKVGITDKQKQRLRTTFEAMMKKLNAEQEKVLKPIYDKYNAKKPENETEARKLQEDAAKEAEAASKKLEPTIKKLRDDWIITVKKTVKAIQLNRFEALMGKPFKS